jgi:predicted DNA-binding ArsR family transcriptional regulator
MARVKLITDPTEIVYALRCLDTEAKRRLFSTLLKEWKTKDEIKEEYGEEGIDALKLFEKMHLLESQWRPVPGKTAPTKMYHILYDAFHIDLTSQITEMFDVLTATIMPEDEFKKIDDKIVELVGDKGIYMGDLIEKLGMSPTMVKSLVRRSSRVMYRGQTVEPVKIE